jgi:hypothetical protein
VDRPARRLGAPRRQGGARGGKLGRRAPPPLRPRRPGVRHFAPGGGAGDPTEQASPDREAHQPRVLAFHAETSREREGAGIRRHGRRDGSGSGRRQAGGRAGPQGSSNDGSLATTRG